MRLGRTIGTVTLVEPHPTMRGGALRLVVPLSAADLSVGDAVDATGQAEPLIAWDDLGSGDGQLVAFSEGGEAAQPFRPLDKPVDAYIAAIIDRLDLPGLPKHTSAPAGQPRRRPT
ncbi:MAG: carbon dioxide concentrating mechanism protein CcmL [Planctomycetota bacterium]|nr:MAG: carbon dioxide concentrating mechanism protein CcmL [Planctomycetota bacterium]